MRQILVTLLVAAALVPGGRAEAVPAFGLPVLLSGSTGFEPGIDVSTNGVVLVNEPHGGPIQGWFWRSVDGGRTFVRTQMPVPYGRFPGGFDTTAAAGRDGRFYVADLSAASTTILRSFDDGATWDGTPLSTLPPSDRPWMAVGPVDEAGDETLYVVTRRFVPGVNIARSTDSGLTWPVHSLGPTGQLPGFTGQLVADDAGFVAFPFIDVDNAVWVARSADAALTWDTVRVSPVNAALAGVWLLGLALDGDTLHAVWVDRSTFSISYSRSADLGATWASPVAISPPGSHVYPWVTAAGGKVAVAWYASDISSATPTHPDGAPAATSWFVSYAESLDGGATFTPLVRASPKAVKKGPVCTAGTGCATNRELGDFFEVTLDGAGRSLIAYGHHGTCPCGTFVVRQAA